MADSKSVERHKLTLQIKLLVLFAGTSLIAIALITFLLAEHTASHTADIAYGIIQRELSSLNTGLGVLQDLVKAPDETGVDPALYSDHTATIDQALSEIAVQLEIIDEDALQEQYEAIEASWHAVQPDLNAWLNDSVPNELTTQSLESSLHNLEHAVFDLYSVVSTSDLEQRLAEDQDVRRIAIFSAGLLVLFIVFSFGMAVNLRQALANWRLQDQALRASEARFRNLLENTSIPVIVHQDGKLVYANPASARIAGTENLEELLGQSAIQFVHPDSQELALSRIRDLVQTGKEQSPVMEKFVALDGQVHDVEVSATPIIFDDKPAIQVVMIDVTERLQAEAARRKQQVLAEALADTAAAVNSTLDVDEVLNRILGNIERVLSYDAVNILLIENQLARIVRARGYVERNMLDYIEHTRFDVEEVVSFHHVVTTKKSLLIPDTQQYEHWVSYPEARWIRSCVSVPIIVQDQVIGLLNADSEYPDHFSAEDAHQLQAFADQAAIAIHNARLYEAEHQRRNVAETLQKASAGINSTLQIDEVLNLILTQLREVLPFDSATIQRTEKDKLSVIADIGFEDHLDVQNLTFALDPRFPNAQVIISRTPHSIVDVKQEYPHFQAEAQTYYSEKIRSWLGVPLLTKDQAIGMIAIDRHKVEPFTPEEIELAVAFANHAAIALSNAQIHDELGAYSQTLENTVTSRTHELHRIKERVEAILNNSTDAIFLLDATGRVEAGNPTVTDMFGFHIDALTGHQPTLIAESGDVDPMEAALQAVRESNEPRRLSFTARHEDGTLFDADAALAPVLQGDELLGMVCSVRDVSVFRQAERMKDEFISNISHELRTPVASIKLYHHLLTATPDKQATYLERLDQEITRLETIINNLLEISEMSQRHQAAHAQPVDVNALVKIYLSDRNPLAEQKELEFNSVFASDLPRIQGDSKMLSRAISILLANAVNYTPAGGTITICTASKQHDGQTCLELTVTDTGPGIPADELPHIFERFFRGAIAIKSGTPGTGLGLSIAHQIIEWHGGGITATNRPAPDTGAIFTVWLPVSNNELGQD